MNYIITKNKEFFERIGEYNYCNLEDMILPEKISYDSETTGLIARKDKVFAIQLGTGANNYLIDLQDHTSDLPFVEFIDKTLYIKEVIPYIKDKTLVMHNSAFDVGFLNMVDFWPKKILDTFLASKILYNGSPAWILHNFGACMERELDIKYDKTEQKNIHKVKLSVPSTIQYCFNDVDKLLELHDVLETKLIDYKAIETYKLHCRYIRALVYMELCGLPLDKKSWKEKMDQDLKLSIENAKIVTEYIYHNLPKFRNTQLNLFDTEIKIRPQLSSVKQMIPVFKEFGINVEVNNKGEKKESIEEGVIKKSKHTFVKLWLAYKKVEHDVTTFGEAILNQIENGRIYTSFNPIVDTARISSRKGAINFLNFPANKATRSCFKANPGFKIVVADYAGQETRTGADITEDSAMISSIVNNKCLHCAFTRVLNPEISHLTDEEIIKDHKEKRQRAKAPRFCFQFGGTAFTLAKNEDIPMEEAKEIETAFRNLHEGLYTYGNKKLEEVLKLGYIESTAGFKLKLSDFDEFKSLQIDIEGFTKDFWEIYREGKKEFLNWKEAQEKNEEYIIQKRGFYNTYMQHKGKISRYFSLKGEYMRLCLNNPMRVGAY